MIRTWQQRSEPLGMFVGLPLLKRVEFPLHGTVGDKAHRFVVRDPSVPLIIQAGPHMSLRPLVSCLAIGRRAACFLHDEEDITHTIRRILAAAPGHVSQIPVAVYKEGIWSSHVLHELV